MANNRINWRECKKAFESLFSFNGFKIIGVEFSGNTLTVTLNTTISPRCPQCGRSCHRYDDTYERSVRDLDVSISSCYITYPVRQIRCDCGYRGNQLIEFVNPYSRFTKRFEDYVAQLSSKMTISAVSDVFGIDWKTVKRIDIAHILDTIPPLESIRPRNIGVDEVAYQKGHKYLTVVRDLDLQAVIWVGIGRSTSTIDEFFTELGPERSNKIETCCMDMWDPYINSVTKNTNAKIIFDKFHLVKIVNGSLDKLRKRVFHAAEPGKKRNFKRKRFLVLYKSTNLPEDKVESLHELLEINKELFIAYILKEQFLDIFEDENRHHMPVLRLIQWMDNVEESGIKELLPTIKTIKRHFDGIVNYFDFGYTNAASEGFNNKINVIKRAAFGFRDLDYFILKIRQTCGFN